MRATFSERWQAALGELKSTTASSRAWTVLGLVVSAVLLWLSFRGIDLASLSDVILKSDYSLVALGALANLGNLWLRAFRWRLLLGPLKTPATGPVFAATMIGFMANNVLPARTGELFKVHVLSQALGISKAAVLATVVSERLLDVTTLFALAVGVLVLGIYVDAAWLVAGTAALAVFGLILAGGLLLFRNYGSSIASWLRASSRGRGPSSFTDRWPRAVEAFADGVDWMDARGTNIILPCIFTSLLIWLGMWLNVYLVALAAHLSLPLAAVLLLLVGQSLGAFIPSGPAQLGTYQFITVSLLGLYAVSQTDALGTSLVLHATRFFPTTIIGLCFFVGWFNRRSRRPAPRVAEARQTDAIGEQVVQTDNLGACDRGR